VLLDVAGEREGLCAKQGTAALVSLIEGTRKRGGYGWGVCLGWQNFEGMYSLRLKHSSSGAMVETVSGDFSVGGLRLGWLSRHRHRMGTVGLARNELTTRWEQSRKAAIGFILDQVVSHTHVASRVALAGSACVGASILLCLFARPNNECMMR